MLSLGLNIWRCISSGSAFNPASLFAGGELGLWHDPSDISTAYQDSAGTTPVTAATQPVGKVNDKSGRGNHAIQATSAARPTYNSASGAKYFTFDGVDDTLATSAITLSADMDCFIAVRRNSATGAIAYTAPGGGVYFGAIDGTAGAASAGAGTPTYAANGVAVPGGTSTTRTQLATALPVGSWIILEVRNCNLSTWTNFAVGAYTGLIISADIGGIILCPAGDLTQREKIRTYLSAKVGIIDINSMRWDDTTSVLWDDGSKIIWE